MVYNHSGKPLMAGAVSDTGGGQAPIDFLVPEQDMTSGSGSAPTRQGSAVTIEWVGGVGRARWYRASVPVQIEQPGGTYLEIFLRPDQFVCANLTDQAHLAQAREGAPRARARASRASLSCAKPRELAALAPGMAQGFRNDSEAHSWDTYDRPGTSTVIFQTLFHTTGQVKIRHGEAFLGGPWLLHEFDWSRPIGKQAAVLVKVNVSAGAPGVFVVTGDAAGWQARYLGMVGDEETQLSPTHLMLGQRMVVDTANAAIFMLPALQGIDYWVLGISDDHQHVAVYWRSARPAGMPPGKEQAATEFGVAMVNLEQGSTADGQVATVPALPADGNIRQFYGTWYRTHCRWNPLLFCK